MDPANLPTSSPSIQKHPSTSSLQEAPLYEMHKIIETMKEYQPEEMSQIRDEMAQMKLKISNLNQQMKGMLCRFIES